MEASEAPSDCILAILSFAGWENPHPSMLHEATVSGHPHWQASRAPTRRTSSFWLVPAIWAAAGRPAISASAKAALRLHRYILLRDAHNFGAGVLQFDFARNQRDDRTDNQQDAADPNPADQRKHVRLDDGFVVLQLGEIQI